MKNNFFKKGIKNIAVSFFLMFLGPTLMFQSLNNEDHPWFLIVFITSILLCILAREEINDYIFNAL